MVMIESSRVFDPRPFVLLVGADEKLRASICYAASGAPFHIEPVGSADEVAFDSFSGIDVIVAWADAGVIEQLGKEMEKAGCWAPILAIGESPSARDVVQAMAAGAIDFIDWPCDVRSMWVAIMAACQLKTELLPRKQRQFEARRAVFKLSPRERQILMAMVDGLTNKVIAQSLQISHRTVEIHRSNLIRKLRASNTADAVRLAFEASLSTDELRRLGSIVAPVEAQQA